MCSSRETAKDRNQPITSLLLFLVDCYTHEFFCRLQSNVFDAASLFQTNHVVHQNAPREDIFSVWRHDFFVLRDVHSNVFIFKRRAYRVEWV